MALALQNAEIYKGVYLYIPWGFRVQNLYDIYIHLHWIGEINYKTVKFKNIEEYKAKTSKLVSEFVEWAGQHGLKVDGNIVYKCFSAYDLGLDGLLWHSTLAVLQNRFIEYTMPRISGLMRRMFEKLITPEIWEMTLTILGGRNVKGGEKTEENTFSMG